MPNPGKRSERARRESKGREIREEEGREKREREKGGGGEREKKIVMYKKEREGNKRIRKPNC